MCLVWMLPVQGHMVKHEIWAYLHWTVGRAVLVLAILNMFLGIGRYRTVFTLGSWAEPALGCYIGAIIIVRAPLLLLCAWLLVPK